ncbi:MAG: response regulator [Spirochaetes bacterium]|nr:MAG: response regulator [Spirochaetota bacterium]
MPRRSTWRRGNTRRFRRCSDTARGYRPWKTTDGRVLKLTKTSSCADIVSSTSAPASKSPPMLIKTTFKPFLSRTPMLARVVFLAALLASLGSCERVFRPSPPPRAHNGILDLRGWDFTRSGPVQLNGEWEFYWERLIGPAEFGADTAPDKTGFISVPGVWNDFKAGGKALPGDGYATIRLRVLIGEPAGEMALQLFTMGTAFSISVNGTVLATVGVPGTSPETSVPAYRPHIVTFAPGGDSLEITAQVSNFHYRKGGPWREIDLGMENDVRDLRERKIIFDMFLFGSLLIMGLYHVGLFISRKKDLAPLYFGIICLIFALRSLVTGHYYLTYLVPGIPFELVITLEYIAFFLGVSAFALYLKGLFPENVPRWFVGFYVAIGPLLTLLTLATPARVYTHTILAFQAAVLVSFVSTIVIIAISIYRRRESAWMFMFGFAVVVFAGVNDILHTNYVIQSFHLLPFAIFIFIFLQAFSLSRRFSRAFYAVEALSEEVSSKNIELTRLDVMKDEFLANTSHELRTPLNGINGLAESLMDGAAGALNSEQRENVGMIAASGRRLATLVNDILDLSRLKNSEITLVLRPVDLRQVVEMMLKISRHLASGKQLALTNDVPGDLPFALCDENRIQQILLNLIGNAIKFTETGEVRVSARRGDPAGMITVTVRDTGIGIPRENLGRIFQAFTQADGSVARQFGGTGLGLSITRSLVELHGGSITVESEPGAGSSFRFTVPLVERGAQEEADAPMLTPARGDDDGRVEAQGFDATEQYATQKQDAHILRTFDIAEQPGREGTVLAVDDDPINLQVIVNYLTMEGYRVVTANSGPRAISLLAAAKPDLVLLDIMMPGMSGYEAAAQIRKAYPYNELPIVLLTARGRVTDLTEGFASGGSDYIVKPFSKSELLTRIRFHIYLKNAFREGKRLARIEQELDIARRIQRNTLPAGPPRSPHFTIAARYISAERVGGDYFDFHVFDDGSLAVFITDVVGHGIPAAFIASMVKLAFSVNREGASDPPAFMRSMSRTLAGNTGGHMLTAELVYLDRRGGRLRCARAGHEPVLVYHRAENRMEEIMPRGILIGYDSRTTFEEGETAFAPGDRIILYTDGLTEARNPVNGRAPGTDINETMFGHDALLGTIMETSTLDADQCAQRIIEKAIEWTGRKDNFEDDVTLLVIDVEG